MLTILTMQADFNTKGLLTNISNSWKLNEGHVEVLKHVLIIIIIIINIHFIWFVSTIILGINIKVLISLNWLSFVGYLRQDTVLYK